MITNICDVEVRKPTVSIVLFIFFNVVYLVYMQGLISQMIYYATIGIYCLYCIFYIFKYKNEKRITDFEFFDGFRNIIVIIFAFWLISTIIQIINQNIQLYLYLELISLLLPGVVAFCILNVDRKNLQVYLYILFLRTVLQFFLSKGSNLSWENILFINWADSASSLTETSLAHAFCLFVIIFLQQKKKFLALISTIFCLFAFKRVAFIFCIGTWIIYWFVPNKKMSKVAFFLISAAFILSPYILLWLYSDAGNSFFSNIFGIELDSFTSSRYTLIRDTMDHFNGSYNGFGSIPAWFAGRGEYWAGIGSFHCDILRIYLECTIIGVVIYIFCVMGIARKSWKIFYMLLYLLIEIIVSHLMGGFIEWILFYLFAYQIVNENSDVKLLSGDRYVRIFKYNNSCME